MTANKVKHVDQYLPPDLDALARIADGIVDADALSGRDPGIDKANFRAGLAVRPKTTREIADILTWCRDNGYSIVPQGGRTGLAGGAATHDRQLILMMDRMDRIIEIDPAGSLAIVEAGVTLETLDAAVAAHGLSAGIDLAARGSCTIGGMVSTNAGGLEAFRNGVMRNRVLGLEAVMADGSLMSDLKRVTKANEGYDIKQLLIGAEGTLGVVTKIVLKLEPAAPAKSTALVSIDSAANGVALFHRLRRQVGGRLRATEIMWRRYFDTTARQLGLDRIVDSLDAPVYLIVEIDGDNPDDLLALLSEAAEDGEILDALVAKNDTERKDIWQIREDSWVVERVFPHGHWFDVSVPQAELDAYVSNCTRKLAGIDPDLKFFCFGHLGDGNLHITISKGKPTKQLYDRLAEVLFTNLTKIGGSFSAEHGIGTEKKHALETYGDPGKLAVMRSIKALLDPHNIMNPGKVIDGRTV